MTTMTVEKFVKAATCPRCGGTGFVASNVVFHAAPGTCFKCGGEGEVESDRATLRAHKVAAEARKAASALVWTGDLGYGVLTDAPLSERAAARNFRNAVEWGWQHLEANEPDRFLACVASINAGRPDVFVALATYAVSVGFVGSLGKPVIAPNGTTIGA